ncbi:hypothetical protein [Nocardiopsis synnemataformans]|uniref:hypothetical protein n=1 Tax=Nocardiopsis synnemataformans TaxID=61305 RepID=UPI003EBFA36E
MKPETHTYLATHKPPEFVSGDILHGCMKVTSSRTSGVLVVVDDYPDGVAHPLDRAETVRLRDWLNVHLGDTATPYKTPAVAGFAAEIDAERQRQITKFGHQHHPDMAGTHAAQCDGRAMFEEMADRYREIDEGTFDPRETDRRRARRRRAAPPLHPGEPVTRNPNDYPRRGRVSGGRAVHALPAKNHHDPQYPGIRRIIAHAACRKEFNLTRGQDTILPPDTPVTCVACNRRLGVDSDPARDAAAGGGLSPDHPINVLLAAATVAEEIADAATEGPWISLDRGDRIIRDTGDDDLLEYVVTEPMSHEGNAAHITLWQPPVARAVAVWLRATAAEWPTQPVITATPTRSAERRAALDTARALLAAKDNT